MGAALLLVAFELEYPAADAGEDVVAAAAAIFAAATAAAAVQLASVIVCSDAGENTVANRKLAVASETTAVVAETGPARFASGRPILKAVDPAIDTSSDYSIAD